MACLMSEFGEWLQPLFADTETTQRGSFIGCERLKDPMEGRNLILYFWRMVRMGATDNDHLSLVVTQGSLAIASTMAARAFNDWSPTSIFRATERSPWDERSHAKPSAHRREDNNLCEHEDQRSVLTAAKGDISTTALSVRSLQRKTVATEPAEQDEDSAARVIQTRLQVRLLYRRERESIEQVGRLRRELERAAATAIIDWLRKCIARFRILEYAAQLRYHRAIRQDARQLIGSWILQQHNASLFRAQLRIRLHARGRLCCWWRRLQTQARCRHRKELKDEGRRNAEENARCLIGRVMWRYMKRRRRRLHQRRQAARCIRAFLCKARTMRRAREEHDRRRQCRRASVKILHALTRWNLRLTLSRWCAIARNQRDNENARLHHAACVLQRLIRVMLTAFRLLRRRDAATKIQSIVRGRQAQRRYRDKLQTRRKAAAITVQRLVRGFLARSLVHRLLQQLRERFKCLNCGLIEPGGLYCKFCGRKRTTFDILGPEIAAGLATTDAKLRKRRKKVPAIDSSVTETSMGLPPAAPLPLVRVQQAKRPPHGTSISSSVLTMDLPDMIPPSPGKASNSTPLPSALLSPRFTATLPSPTPIKAAPYPRKPHGVSHLGGRPGNFHRSVSVADSTRLPTTGLVSVDKTRQRAETLMQHDNQRFQLSSQSTMSLHLQRLQKGGKAASR